MSSRKVYYATGDGSDSMSELEIYRNTKGCLFITLSDQLHEHAFIVLPREDALKIITELAFAFNLIDDNPELEGKMMWCGDSR